MVASVEKYKNKLSFILFGFLLAVTDDQVVPNTRYARKKSEASDLAAFIENASEAQLGAVRAPRQRKATSKGRNPRTTSKSNAMVPTMHSSTSSSAVSFRVPQSTDGDKVSKFDNNSSTRTPERTSVSPKGCNSETRRKVNQWFTEQCVTPSVISEPVSDSSGNERTRREVVNKAKSMENESNEADTKASEESGIIFGQSAGDLDVSDSNHILVESDDSSAASGPVERQLRRRVRTMERTKTPVSLHRRQRNEKKEDVYRNIQSRKQDSNENLMHIRGTPPSRFKSQVSSPGSDDPYLFKASPKVPSQKGKKVAVRRQRRAVTESKMKKEVVVIPGEEENKFSGVDGQKHQEHQLRKDKEQVYGKGPGVKRMAAYGKDHEVVLFDEAMERNTDLFSSPTDIERTKKQNGKKAPEKDKHSDSTVKIKPDEKLQRMVDEISLAEDYDLVFSQQIRDEADEYRKMFKKNTRDNPRNNRVSFGNDVTVVSKDGEKNLKNITDNGAVKAADSTVGDTGDENPSEPEETIQMTKPKTIKLHNYLSKNSKKLKLRRSDPVSGSTSEKGAYHS